MSSSDREGSDPQMSSNVEQTQSKPEQATSPSANLKADTERTTRKLAGVGIGGNILLVIFKLIAGILGNSMAMISDAIHSLSDVAATAIAFIGSKLAAREADTNHPYGHERIECLAALILGSILFATACGIGYAGATSLTTGAWETMAAPTALALSGAIISIVVKELMFRYTMHHAKRIKSQAFMADACHHRSDALSSIGALIGIGASMAGFGMGDALASLVVCLFIFKAAFDILHDAVNNMMDTAADPDTVTEIESCITAQAGVVRLDILRTRAFGNRIYVDAEIAADGNLTLTEAHAIAERTHNAVESQFPDVKHIMIHVNPA